MFHFFMDFVLFVVYFSIKTFAASLFFIISSSSSVIVII
ncbi:putative membrane protein [Escherichia coli DEC3C]|nr:putative membrane protein [Escherichia coli DEC3C]EHU70414.1 putative membrane protein [Escherichia coli DEC3D]